MTDPRAPQLAVLAHHKIGPPGPRAWNTWYYVSESAFAAQLDYLRENKWQVLSVDTFLDVLDGGPLPSERMALITFDDGYRCVREYAMPILQGFGYSALMFVPTRYIGGTNAFDAGIEPEEPICDWDELRELSRAGVSIQSHSVSHSAFSTLTLAQQLDELRLSKLALEQGLGQPVQFFSYPYGDEGSCALRLASEMKQMGYRAACLYGGPGNVLPIPDCFRVTRLALGSDTDLAAVLTAAR